MKTRKLERMGKRNFLKTLAALGASPSVLATITKDDLGELTDDPEAEVPRVFSWSAKNREDYLEPPYPDEPPEMVAEYYTIPRDWWGYVEATNDGGRKIQSLIDEEDQTGQVTSVISHRDEREINVDYKRTFIRTDEGKVLIGKPDVDFEELESKLPSQIDGKAGRNGYEYTREDIPVILEKKEKILDHSCGSGGGPYYDGTYDDIPGGCEMIVESQSNCSTGSPAFDYDLMDYVILTAGHCTYDTDNETPSEGEGRTAYQPNIGSFWEIGPVDEVDSHTDCDAASIEITESGRSHEYALAEDSANSYDEDIAGTLGWDPIDDKTVGVLYRQGRTTGRCLGTIERTSEAGCKLFEIDADSSGGDSGGPHFHIESDDAYIAGIHHGRILYAAAHYIGEIEDKFNVAIP